MKDELFYVVLRLNKEIEHTTLLGNRVSIELSGCAGFLPVYDNIDDAIEASSGGKYEIVAIQETK